MIASGLIDLSGLMDDAKYSALMRQHQWPEGACCLVCGNSAVIWTAMTIHSPVASVAGARRALGASTT